jgi:hypothetical protein
MTSKWAALGMSTVLATGGTLAFQGHAGAVTNGTVSITDADPVNDHAGGRPDYAGMGNCVPNVTQARIDRDTHQGLLEWTNPSGCPTVTMDVNYDLGRTQPYQQLAFATVSLPGGQTASWSFTPAAATCAEEQIDLNLHGETQPLAADVAPAVACTAALPATDEAPQDAPAGPATTPTSESTPQVSPSAVTANLVSTGPVVAVESETAVASGQRVSSVVTLPATGRSVALPATFGGLLIGTGILARLQSRKLKRQRV